MTISTSLRNSSRAATRTGTITLGNTTCDYTIEGPTAIAGANAVLTQTTDMTGANPTADCAVFSGLSGSSQTVNFDVVYGGGISAFQIVAVPEPGTLALVSLSGFAILALRRRAAKI